MKVQVSASVPTIHQAKTLKTAIGSMPYEANPDGSFSFSHVFEKKKEAKKWLIERAYYVSLDRIELQHMLSEIKHHNMLTVDTVTIRIDRLN